jgi:predicted ABC-type ATPase
MDLESLKVLYKIADKEFEEIQSDIIGSFASAPSPTENPVAIILGAQPGAGKTELEKEARQGLMDNVVICNADLFRDFHPFAKTILSKYEAFYPEITSDYANARNIGFKDYCERNRLKYILETTFSSGERMNNTISELKQKGYRVEIKLLAVHPKLSFFGSQLRFEESKLRTGVGRLVPKSVHDSRFRLIRPTLVLVHKAGLYNSLQIYARNIVVNHGSLSDGIHLVANNPVNALKVYQDVVEHKK